MLIIRPVSCLPGYLFLLILLLSHSSAARASNISPPAVQVHPQPRHPPEIHDTNSCHDGNPREWKRAATDIATANPHTLKITITDWTSLESTPSSLTAMQTFYEEALQVISTLSPSPTPDSTITLIFGSLLLTLTLTPTDPTDPTALSTRQFIPDPSMILAAIIKERLEQVKRGLIGLFKITVRLVGFCYFIGVMQGILPLQNDEHARQRAGWGFVQYGLPR